MSPVDKRGPLSAGGWGLPRRARADTSYGSCAEHVAYSPPFGLTLTADLDRLEGTRLLLEVVYKNCTALTQRIVVHVCEKWSSLSSLMFE